MLTPTLKSIARGSLHTCGLVGAVRASNRHVCRILVYHRFPEDQSHLAAQCEHIRRHYKPVSMTQVGEALAGGAPLPHHSIAVTIDDGFRDFLRSAHPVFLRYAIPVTVFVVTDFIDGKTWLWFSQIEYIVSRTKCASVRFLGREFVIKDDGMRAAVKITGALKTLRNADRIAQVEALGHQLCVRVPECPPAEFEALSWDDVRKLALDGVDIGSHTRSHPVLSSILDPAELRYEIAGSKCRLEEALGRPVLHFCYPFGTAADFNEQITALIRGCGHATAVMAESGMNYRKADPFRLLRLGVIPTFPERHFIELLAGFRKY